MLVPPRDGRRLGNGRASMNSDLRDCLSSRSSRRSRRRSPPAGLPTPARGSSRSSARRAISRANTTISSRARAPISSGSTAARNRSASTSSSPRIVSCSSAMSREGRRVHPESRAGRRRAARPCAGGADGAFSRALIYCSISGYGEDGPLSRPQGLRSAGAGRERACRRSTACRGRRVSACRSATSPPE